MILDPNGIVAHAGASHAKVETPRHADTANVDHRHDKQSLLLFSVGEDAPKAVPLSLVARLEQVDRATIEYSNGSPVVQYREKLMPLVSVLPDRPIMKEGFQPIVVFSDQDQNVGLLVDSILDIVEDTMHVDLSSKRQGFLGTSIISGKSTDIIDAAHYLAMAFRDWFNADSQGTYTANAMRRILLIDDSSFFRNLLTPLLTVAGYDVTTVNSAAEALELQESGRDFDILVSDIEMPGMSGFDFASSVRRGGRWSRLPMLALSSHATENDFERGRQAGFTDYVAKFNREALLATLQKNLAGTEVNS
jgi:two-component system chemotaxis sensor kinase CheA